MSTVVNQTPIAADDVRARLAKIRGSVDAIAQIIAFTNSAIPQGQQAEHQLKLANDCLAQAQAALLRLAELKADFNEADALNWDFHIAQPPARRMGAVSVVLSPKIARTVPADLDPLAD